MNSPLFERFDAATTREKLMFFATLIVIIYSAWDHLFLQSLLAERKQLTADLSNLHIELSAQKIAATQIESTGKIDPNIVDKKKLVAITAELKKLKQGLNIGDKKFVSADLMVVALQDMLKQNAKLSLISLDTLKVTEFTELEEQQKSWIFRHGLSITVRGDYFATLNYLQALEALDWRFSWDSITYKVIEYPIAETTLQIYILSFEENWLGL